MAVDPNLQKVEESGLEIVREVFGPILNRGVKVSIKEVEAADVAQLAQRFTDTPVIVEAPLAGLFEGSQYYIFSQKLAAAITDLMVMGDGTAPFNEQESLDGISEATNQLVGALATYWSDQLGSDIKPTGANGELKPLDQLNLIFSDYTQVEISLEIDDWGEDSIIKLVPNQLLEVLRPVSQGEQSEAASAPAAAPPPPAASVSVGPGQGVQSASFGEFGPDVMIPSGDKPKNLDLLLDISLPVTIELGRTSMLIRDILEIGPGSVIELQKLSGEPVDLYVNDKKFALGEVVVIDENFGIRITELLSVEDRIKALR